jgi:hypothetical protein
MVDDHDGSGWRRALPTRAARFSGIRAAAGQASEVSRSTAPSFGGVTNR